MTIATRPSPGSSAGVLVSARSNGRCSPTACGIAVAPMPRLPIVTVLALVDAGASCDAAGREGAASLTIGALAEGTSQPRRRDAHGAVRDARDGAVEFGGDWDDATTHIAVTPERLATAVGLLGEVLRAPAFARTGRDAAQGGAAGGTHAAAGRAARTRRRQVLRIPVRARLAVRAFRPRGGMASVRALDAAQLRALHAARYVPGATTLVLAGDVTMDRAVRARRAGVRRLDGRDAVRTCSVDDRSCRGGTAGAHREQGRRTAVGAARRTRRCAAQPPGLFPDRGDERAARRTVLLAHQPQSARAQRVHVRRALGVRVAPRRGSVRRVDRGEDRGERRGHARDPARDRQDARGDG